jgi:hypothetical protein
LLWQTDTITIAWAFYELFNQTKVLINTEKLQLVKPINLDKVFVLSLPLNEIHELGLMYLNYEILSRGYKTIYLGRVCPLTT